MLWRTRPGILSTSTFLQSLALSTSWLVSKLNNTFESLHVLSTIWMWSVKASDEQVQMACLLPWIYLNSEFSTLTSFVFLLLSLVWGLNSSLEIITVNFSHSPIVLVCKLLITWHELQEFFSLVPHEAHLQSDHLLHCNRIYIIQP